MMYQSEIFEKDFLKYFNRKYSTNEMNFQKAMFFIINKIFSKIPVKSRKVIRLSKLEENLTDDECLSISKIEKAIEEGKGIEKYMSKGIDRISNIDTFFNLYRIYHFHLGKETNNKFVERSKNLLFVYFTNNEAYFICVKEHPIKEEWGTVEPIRILYKEYPQLFSERVIKCEDMQPKITKDEEYFLLFKEGLNYPVKVDDKTYILPFGISVNSLGQTKSGVNTGTNIKVGMTWGRFYNRICVFFGKIKNNCFYKYDFEILDNSLKIIAFYNIFKIEIYYWNFYKNCLLNEKGTVIFQ